MEEGRKTEDESAESGGHSSSVLGLSSATGDRRDHMARKVKVGLVGLGSLAQRGILPHTFQDDAREKIEAVAVCDNVPGRAVAVAEKWNWAEAYTDFEAMLAHADLEAVFIATPIPLHYRQAMAA